MAAIGIIGRGRLGTALGSALQRGGHQITWADSGGGHREAVADADVVVLAVPFAAVDDALGAAGELRGKVLWSCVNALRPDLSGLAVGFDTSAAEQVADRAPGARVVAALPPFAEPISAGTLDYGKGRAATFLCGDDPEAKRVVSGLIEEIGAEPVDAGDLRAARLVEPAMMLLVALAYGGQRPRDVALGLLERTRR